MANLVIIESPGKVSTIKHCLGSNYKVVASVGHVRDLPKSTLGIDVDDHFKAHYINIRGKGDLIRELKKEAKSADYVYLATDPDREGEAISWHLANALALPPEKIRRVTFNEITKTAVKSAIKKPRNIDMDLVNSQQARRILDRIVGYKISPFFWKNVKSGLSAGRVQSVAARIIVDRENEIRAFEPKEYWTVDAQLETPKGKSFTAHFHGDIGSAQKREITCEADASAIRDAVAKGEFRVAEVKKGTKFRAPAAPFKTSTMQQEASRKLNFQSQRTMKVAQELYEGVNVGTEHGGVQGLITYMRTDSLRVSQEAQEAARSFIRDQYGDAYCPREPRVYKTKANAQDAHEAVRPTNVSLVPTSIRKYLSSDQYKLYKLIWERFIASQMESAEMDTVNAEITAAGYLYRAAGTTVKFPGFLAVYEESAEESGEGKTTKLPAFEAGDVLRCLSVDPQQHFTEAPPRYTEASLVKFLEEKGIGRPSTFAQIVTLIISRGYVKREGKSLVPTPLGEITTKLMIDSFPDIVDYKFTAQMEDKLDSVAGGEETMEAVLADFYEGFAKELSRAEETVSRENIEIPVEETDIICEQCGARMIIKNGRYGKFAACPNYPTCKNTKPLEKPNTEKEPAKEVEIAPFKCDICGSDMVLRSGRFGDFYACVRYPECKNTRQKTKSTGVACPKCGADIVMKWGKRRTVFYSCERYPECDYSSWDMPSPEKCPDCGEILYHKKGKNLLVCKKDGCGYKREIESETTES